MQGIRRCALVLGFLLFGGTALHAQSAPAGKSTNEGVYTAEQAARGEKVSVEVCSMCHSPKEDFTRNGFLNSWTGKPIRALFHNLKETMPEDMPGSLSAQQYADVVAYILKLNGMPTGSSELKSDDESLSTIIFERKKQ